MARAGGIALAHPLRLGALLLASWTLGSEAWWPFGSADADIVGKYSELDPANNWLGHGKVIKSGASVQAVFEGSSWSPAFLTVTGTTVNMGGIAGQFAGGYITWSNGFRWRLEKPDWVPGPPPSAPAQDDDSATCNWKPVADHGEGSTICYGHSVKHHDDTKEVDLCLESYAKDNDCNFVSFDESIGRCYCKLSCPARVLSPSTSSFEKETGVGGALAGNYVEFSPEGNAGMEGWIFQQGGKLTAEFPGQSWSPTSGTANGYEVTMFGGNLKGFHNDGTITWQNGWKWVYQGPLRADQVPGAADATADSKAEGDAKGVNNDGWVSSRDQTPHIAQEVTELADFVWKAAANVTCEVSEEDVRFYDEHGWVHLKQVLDPGALDLILDEAQTICVKQLKTRGVCQIEQLRWQVNRFRDFMLYSPMGCYAHKLIRGRGVRITTEALFGTQYNEKNPNFFSYNFHVDSMAGHRGVYHAFTTKSKGVSVWFPMHDVDPDVTGGSVYVIDEYTGNKVTHHCKYQECGGQVLSSKSVAPKRYQCSPECAKYGTTAYHKTFKFEKGDAVFWHPEMPHATQPVKVRNFTRHSFTIRLVELDAEVCNVGGNCGDWMGCCADLPLANGKIHNHCFPQIYPKVLDEEVVAHYSSTPKHLMGDQSWVDHAHTVPRAPDCL